MVFASGQAKYALSGSNCLYVKQTIKYCEYGRFSGSWCWLGGAC